MNICIYNTNIIPKWIKEIFASECNLENEKAIHERHHFRLTSKLQAVDNICTHGGSVVVVDLQLPMQSVHITTSVMSSNPDHGEVYSTQHYVIKYILFGKINFDIFKSITY